MTCGLRLASTRCAARERTISARSSLAFGSPKRAARRPCCRRVFVRCGMRLLRAGNAAASSFCERGALAGKRAAVLRHHSLGDARTLRPCTNRLANAQPDLTVFAAFRSASATRFPLARCRKPSQCMEWARTSATQVPPGLLRARTGRTQSQRRCTGAYVSSRGAYIALHTEVEVLVTCRSSSVLTTTGARWSLCSGQRRMVRGMHSRPPRDPWG